MKTKTHPAFSIVIYTKSIVLIICNTTISYKNVPNVVVCCVNYYDRSLIKIVYFHQASASTRSTSTSTAQPSRSTPAPVASSSTPNGAVHSRSFPNQSMSSAPGSHLSYKAV